MTARQNSPIQRRHIRCDGIRPIEKDIQWHVAKIFHAVGVLPTLVLSARAVRDAVRRRRRRCIRRGVSSGRGLFRRLDGLRCRRPGWVSATAANQKHRYSGKRAQVIWPTCESSDSRTIGASAETRSHFDAAKHVSYPHLSSDELFSERVDGILHQVQTMGHVATETPLDKQNALKPGNVTPGSPVAERLEQFTN